MFAFALLCGMPMLASAADAGPARDVAAIRSNGKMLFPTLVISDVVVDGDHASAMGVEGKTRTPLYFMRRRDQWWFSGSGAQRPAPYDGYGTQMHFASPDRQRDVHVDTFHARMPTDSESPLTRGGDGYYFASFSFAIKSRIGIPAGSTMDVWFPHVLRDDKKYSLTFTWGNRSFGPVFGTLAQNTLHFVLPSFTIAPGEKVMAEIDGDP